MHGDHPPRVQVKEGSSGVGGAGMNVAKRWRIVCADGKQRELWRKSHANFAEARKICGIAGVVNGMLIVPKNVAAVSAMRVAQNARTPMARRSMRYREAAMAVVAPPVQLDNVAEAEIGDEVKHMLRHDHSRRRSAPAFGVLHQTLARIGADCGRAGACV